MCVLWQINNNNNNNFNKFAHVTILAKQQRELTGTLLIERITINTFV